MNWYKRAQAEYDIENLEDRTHLNEKIRRLEAIAAMLSYASRLIFQTQRGARSLVQQAMAEKSLSSYPQVIEILGSADQVALDSPYKFADICLESMDEIVRRARNLKRQRDDWGKPKNTKKGWF